MFKTVIQTSAVVLGVIIFMVMLPILLYIAATMAAAIFSWLVFQVIREYNEEQEAAKKGKVE